MDWRTRLRVFRRIFGAFLWTLCCVPVGIFSALLSLVSRWRGLKMGAFGTRMWSWGMLKALGVRVRAEGTPPPPGSFAVSNHLSTLDIIVLGSLYRQTFIAKAEIAAWPGVGLLSRLVGTLFIDRNRRRDTSRLNQEVGYLLDKGLTVLIFAEGTSWNGSAILPFKPSLFETPSQLQVPCVPIAVSYRTPGDGPGPGGPDGGWPHLTVCWWGDMPFGPHALSLARIPRVEASVRFGEPVNGLSDRKALAAELHRRVSAQFTPVPQ